MITYWLYVLHAAGHFKGVKTVDAIDDREAISRGSQIIAGAAFEIWTARAQSIVAWASQEEFRSLTRAAV